MILEDVINEEPVAPFIVLPVLRGFEEIRDFFEWLDHNKVIIAGGYARFCASPKEKPVKAGDLDLFPLIPEVSQELIDKLLAEGFEKRHENEVSYTFKKQPEGRWANLPTIQIIKPVNEGSIHTVGSVESILENFDFTVTRIALLNANECLADSSFLKDEETNLLRFKNIHCPISSLIRVVKYAKKGYHIRPAEVMKLFADWDNRDDDYKLRMLELFHNSDDPENSMSQQEIDELEKLLRID